MLNIYIYIYIYIYISKPFRCYIKVTDNFPAKWNTGTVKSISSTVFSCFRISVEHPRVVMCWLETSGGWTWSANHAGASCRLELSCNHMSPKRM